jgi:hypothetical protein
MPLTDPSLEETLQHLRQFRFAVLNLHKELLNSERAVYEQLYGRIQSSHEFFRLVVEHEWFKWLRPISQLIVQMDDVLRAKEPVSLANITTLLKEASLLLQPSEEGTTTGKQYYQAIQRDPKIALMHAEISKLFVK